MRKLCTFCGLGNYKYYASIGSREIEKCKYCGVLRLKVLPDKKTAKKIINSIESSFFSEYEDETNSYKEYFKTKITDIKKYSKQKYLLDIGCSTGVFLSVAKRRGYKCEGYDYSKEAVKYCRDKGLNVNYRDVDNLQTVNKRFDIITAFQIIEHLTKPDDFIRWISASLNKNGLVVITTPDVNGFMPTISGKKWFGYKNLEHFYFFTKKSLVLILLKHGFEILRYQCETGRGLSINYILERLKNYYYYDNLLFKNIFNIMGKMSYFIGDLRLIREPRVNIYIIAKKVG